MTTKNKNYMIPVYKIGYKNKKNLKNKKNAYTRSAYTKYVEENDDQSYNKQYAIDSAYSNKDKNPYESYYKSYVSKHKQAYHKSNVIPYEQTYTEAPYNKPYEQTYTE